MDDLIERLRAFEGSDALGNGDFAVCYEAIDRIAALEAENARLMGLVKEAFMEGFQEGYNIGDDLPDAEGAWSISDTLAKIKEATDGRVTD